MIICTPVCVRVCVCMRIEKVGTCVTKESMEHAAHGCVCKEACAHAVNNVCGGEGYQAWERALYRRNWQCNVT